MSTGGGSGIEPDLRVSKIMWKPMVSSQFTLLFAVYKSSSFATFH